MDQPLVSIIVPVYNIAPYLERCLNSLRGQTWQALEVWLVDDGSTDSSLAICRAAEAADSRFHVIHQDNAGVSQARNAALERATGKDLHFAVGDDYLPPDATETLVRNAEAAGADLVIAHFYRVTGDHQAQRGHIKDYRIMTRQEFAGEMMKAPSNFYYGVLWNKLFRRRIVEQHHLRFEKDIHWCEDFLFNLEYIKYARLISAVPKPVYYYVKRENSLVTQTNLRQTIAMKRTTFACYKALYQALDLYEEQKLGVYRYLISAATDGAVLDLPKIPGFNQKKREKKAGTPGK